MAGRRPKPTHLKLLQGNPGKRPLNGNEPKPAATIPDVPEHLSEAAKAEWTRMSVELNKLGLLTVVDRSAFAGYCMAWGRWVEAEQALKKTGPVVRAPSGYPILSPYLAVANRALEHMRMFLIEFGMTPASRAKLSVRPYDDEDPFEQWMRQR
jgi:P27 family predicted phage terminase small subunit